MKVGGDVFLSQRLKKVFGEATKQAAGVGFCRAAGRQDQVQTPSENGRIFLILGGKVQVI